MKKLLLIFLWAPLSVGAQIITTYAGTGGTGSTGNGGPAVAANCYRAIDVCVHGGSGSSETGTAVYVVEEAGCVIRKIDASGTISPFVGNGSFGFSGDGGPATAAKLFSPQMMFFDATGNLYFSDANNGRIRKVSTTGIITTFAGNGTWGFAGDGGPATAAELFKPGGIFIDAAGNMYFADSYNHRVRKINTAGIITTIAGTGTIACTGDGGPATAAASGKPGSVWVDAAGNVYFTDFDFNRVRKIDVGGIISTVVGTGVRGSAGDGGPATAAELAEPFGLKFDAAGNMYIADFYNNKIRKVDPSGIITTIAGTGTLGFSGDGGPATAARLYGPTSLDITPDGVIYIADDLNNRIRRITPGTTNSGSIPEAGNHMNLYPNPATHYVTVSAGDNVRTMSIYNLYGQELIAKLFTGDKKNEQIDVSFLPSGVYLVRVNGSISCRLIKE